MAAVRSLADYHVDLVSWSADVFVTERTALFGSRRLRLISFGLGDCIISCVHGPKDTHELLSGNAAPAPFVTE